MSAFSISTGRDCRVERFALAFLWQGVQSTAQFGKTSPSLCLQNFHSLWCVMYFVYRAVRKLGVC